MTCNIQYIVDNRGNTTGVIIPIKEWDKIIFENSSFLNNNSSPKGSSKKHAYEVLEAFKQVKLHSDGKIKLKSAKQMLDEFDVIY